VIWFRLWWYAMGQGLWRTPVLAALTLGQTFKVAFVLWMRSA
jgi:hypothetical protein